MAGLASAVDADDRLSIRAEPAGYVPTASRVSMEPLSSDDWEILEANADYLEGQMLTQACARGDRMSPSSFVRLFGFFGEGEEGYYLLLFFAFYFIFLLIGIIALAFLNLRFYFYFCYKIALVLMV